MLPMATTPLVVSMDLPLQAISCDVASLSCLLHPRDGPCRSLARSTACSISLASSTVLPHSPSLTPRDVGRQPPANNASRNTCVSFYVDVCFPFSTSGHAKLYGNSTFSILINSRTVFPKGLPDFTYAGVSR